MRQIYQLIACFQVLATCAACSHSKSRDTATAVVVATVPPTPPATATADLIGSPGTQVQGNGFRKCSENEYAVPREELDRILSDWSMQARIVPALKDGLPLGFKLFSIRPDSIYTRIDIQNGDVIRRMNGYELNTTDNVVEMYLKLRTANRIDIALDRFGSLVSRTLYISASATRTDCFPRTGQNPGTAVAATSSPTPTEAVRAPLKGPSQNNVQASRLKKLSENEYQVPQEEFDRILSDFFDFFSWPMQARIVPAFKDGLQMGFKLFSLRPDSIYKRIGIQDGDVVRRVNGYEFSNWEQYVEMYANLRKPNRIDIELDRDGTMVRKTLYVR